MLCDDTISNERWHYEGHTHRKKKSNIPSRWNEDIFPQTETTIFCYKIRREKDRIKCPRRRIPPHSLFFLCEYFLFFYQIRNEIMFDA